MTDFKKAPGQQAKRTPGIIGMTPDGSPVMLRPAAAPAAPPTLRKRTPITRAESTGVQEFVEARSARLEAARLKAEVRWWAMTPTEKAAYATRNPEQFLSREQWRQWQEAGSHPAYVADDGSIRFPLSYAEWMSRLAEEDY